MLNSIAGRALAAALLVAAAAAGLALAALPGSSGALTVFAASDVAAALREIAADFERETGARVRLVFGSSGNLSLQIEHGAPADVFLSANEAFVDRLALAGRVEPDTRAFYATGRLALAWARVDPAPAALAALGEPRFRRVAIANPAHAPYGMAAEEALSAAGVWDEVRPKLVYGENVRQAHQMLETGAVEAALVARSLVDGSGLRWTLVDAALHAPLVQPAVVVRGSRSPDLARRFVAWLTGPEGRAVLARHSFEPPPVED